MAARLLLPAAVVLACGAVAASAGAEPQGGGAPSPPAGLEEDDPGYRRKVVAPETSFGEEPAPGSDAAEVGAGTDAGAGNAADGTSSTTAEPGAANAAGTEGTSAAGAAGTGRAGAARATGTSATAGAGVAGAEGTAATAVAGAAGTAGTSATTGAGAAGNSTLAARAVRPSDGGLAQGIGARVGYRTLQIGEAIGPPDAAVGGVQGFGLDRFHALSLDVYPISWYPRLGLSTQIGLETGSNDFFATEGILVGLQWPGRITPFVEGGAHVGMARRTMWLYLDAEPADNMTLLWALAGEAGVDVRLVRSFAMSVAVGLQRSSYFYTAGDLEDPLLVRNDTSFTLRVGFGY